MAAEVAAEVAEEVAAKEAATVAVDAAVVAAAGACGGGHEIYRRGPAEVPPSRSFVNAAVEAPGDVAAAAAAEVILVVAAEAAVVAAVAPRGELWPRLSRVLDHGGDREVRHRGGDEGWCKSGHGDCGGGGRRHPGFGGIGGHGTWTRRWRWPRSWTWSGRWPWRARGDGRGGEREGGAQRNNVSVNEE